MTRWWGPDGFTTATAEINLRPGGVRRYVMTGPDGNEYQNRIVYDEIVEPEYLAYSHGSDDDPDQFRVAVTFDEREGGKTALTMRMRFASEAERDVAAEFGAVEGAKQTLDRLDVHLATRRNGGET